MPPPAGASFAQYFPAAPRAARDRAIQREKAKLRSADSPSSSLGDLNGSHTPSSRTDESGQSHGRRDEHPADAPPLPPDDTESLLGDTLNTVGSASSHASTASSVFSSSAQQNGLAASKNLNHTLTPLTNADSPTPPMSSHVPNPSTSVPQTFENGGGPFSKQSTAPNGAPPSLSHPVDRIPARDPGRAVKGVRCTHDPLLDKAVSTTDKRKARPTYKEWGSVCTRAILPPPKGERHLTAEGYG